MPVSIKVEGTNIRRWLEDVVSQEKEALKDDYKSAVVPRTPIKTGRARRGWRTGSSDIRNEVPYIGKLESGYSRQAPSGFVKDRKSVV